MIEELKEHKSLVIALIVVLLIAAGGILYMQGNSAMIPGSKDTTQDIAKPGMTDKEIVRGMLSIAPISGRHIYEKGESVVLLLIGNSDGKDAVGFDAALKINQDILTFSQSTSKLPSFETFDNVNDERIYVGGIRRLDSKSASIFDNAELAELTFTAQAEGHSNVDFLFKPDDTTESNIVLTTSKDGLGDVKGTDIYVGKKVEVTTSSPVVVPNTNITLTLKDTTVESANMDVSVGGRVEPKKFMWSTGSMSKNIEDAAGYVFQAEKVPGNKVVVYYAAGKSLN